MSCAAMIGADLDAGGAGWVEMGMGVQFVAMVVVGVSRHHWRGYWSRCHCHRGINHSVVSSEGLHRSWGQETCNPGLLECYDLFLFLI